MDVTDEQSVQCAVLEREDHLDIVVNNAGIAIAGPVERTSMKEANRQKAMNLFGMFRVCRAVLPTPTRNSW